MPLISKRRWIIFFITLMSALSQMGLVLYTPAFLQIVQTLHLSSSQAEATLAAYLIGFGVSQIFYGPLSDRMGRKKPLLLGTVIFCLGCLLAIFTNDYTFLFTARVIQGLGAGATITLSRSILRDSFSGKEYAEIGSYLSVGFALGLGISPLIGGHLLDYFSWRSEFIFLFFFGVLLLFLYGFFLPETHFAQPLKIKKITYVKTVLAHFFTSLKNISFLSYLIGGVMAYSVVVAYSTMTPILFQKDLGYSSASYGWITFFVACCYYAGATYNRKFVSIYGAKNLMKMGIALILFAGITMLLLRVFFHAFNLYVILLPMMVGTFGQALIWSNCITGALKDLGHIAGTAAAIFSCLQMSLAAVISALIALPAQSSQIPLAVTIIILGLLSGSIFRLTIWKK